MKRYLYPRAIFVITFTVGLACSYLLNRWAPVLIEQYETACNFANATVLWSEPALTAPTVRTCGHLFVTVKDDRTLYLNQNEMGTLQDPEVLVDRLWQAFRVRSEYHVYREGMTATNDIPEDRRIEKTVILRVDGSVSYGETAGLIEALKKVGADPIALTSIGVRPSAGVERCARRSGS